MSLAVDHLRDYLERENITQDEFGTACGYDASLVSNVLSGKVGISARNISRLLHGVNPPAEKLKFIAAYLRDQIPAEHVYQLSVNIESDESTDGTVQEEPASVFDIALPHLIDELPLQTKTLVYYFVKALRRDPQLRLVFEGVMRYVPTDAHANTKPFTRQPHTEEQSEGQKPGTAGPFAPGALKKAQARAEAEAARKRGKKKSTRGRGIPARDDPAHTATESG